MMLSFRIIAVGLLSGFFLSGFSQQAEPELFAPGVVSGPLDDAAPAFSPDSKTVYFHRRGPGVDGVILVSHFRSGKWSMPVVASFSGQWQDIEPAMAPDGSYLIFSSNRPVVASGQRLNGGYNGQHFAGGGGNLWRVDRNGDGWGEPYRLPGQINSDTSVFSPAIAANGCLYFMKPVGDGGKFHLYRCVYRNGEYGAAEALPFSAVDSIGDFDPAVAADETYLVFSSKRPPSKQTELWIVFQRDGHWGEPVSLGAAVNRTGRDIEARLSPDGRRLYFSCPFVAAPPVPSTVSSTQAAVGRGEWETGMLNIWSVSLDPWLAGGGGQGKK